MSELIEARGVNRAYQSGHESIWALKKATLSISAGDFLAVVGPSGAGKSTLLHLLGGLDSPTEGEVLFKGKNINRQSDKNLSLWRAQHVGFVFQFYHLIEELTAMENVLLASRIVRRKFSLNNIRELIQYLGIEHRIHSYPSQLSGGERQKVALARALANDPELILCDEPTGNLDRDSQDKVTQLLEGLNRDKEKTIVLVTHNLDLAKKAKRILFIEDGFLKA